MGRFILTGPGSNFAVGDGEDFASKVIDVSAHVTNQLPAFIRSDHPKFVAFLEAYYEWMETEHQALFESKTVLLNQDVDRCVDDFVQYFKQEFLHDIPNNILADKRLLTKYIKDFYRARGSEKSYKLLLRILFDKNVEFYYPARDMLRVDDGKWIRDTSLRVVGISGNVFALEGTSVRTQSSGASGIVERVIKLQESTYEIYELFFNRLSIEGTFGVNETLSDLSNNVFVRILPVVTNITITDAGEDYSVGDVITIADSSGVGATAQVKAVGPDGNVRFIEMLTPGVNYSDSTTITFPTTASTATGEAVIGALFEYPGYWLTEDGHLDTTKFLQDNYYYQQFSYVLLIDEALNSYRDIVKKILHPCGLILFGGIDYIDVADLQAQLAGGEESGAEMTLAIFALLNMSMNQNNFGIDLHRDLVKLDILSTLPENGFHLGPSLRSLERDKFWYLPTDYTPGENDLFFAPNEDYWLQYANYQLSDFDNILVEDVISAPWLKINICPEPYLIIRSLSDDLLASYAGIEITSDFNPDEDANITIAAGLVSQLDDDRNLVAALTATGSDRPYATRNDSLENLLVYSEELDDSSWTKVNCTISANDETDPLGLGATADLIVEDNTAAAEHSVAVLDQIHFIEDQQYVFSGWLKMAGRRYVRVQFDLAAKVDSYAIYDLQTNSVTQAAGLDYANIQVTSVSGWIKFNIAFTSEVNLIGDVKIYLSNSSSSITYSGDGVSGVHAWGLQVRDSRSASTYIKSEGLVNYRGINGCRALKCLGTHEMESTTDLADLFLDDTQTCFVVFVPDDVSQSKGIIISDTDELWQLYVESGNLKFSVNDGSVKTISTAILSGETYVIKLRHESGFVYVSVNGGSELSIACGDITGLTGTLSLGAVNGGDYFMGTVGRLITDDDNQSVSDQTIIFNLLSLQYGL